MSVINQKNLDPSDKQYKYEFTLQIVKFICEVPLNCSIKIRWQRGTKHIQTRSSYEVKSGLNQVPIKDEKMSNNSTFVYNTKTKEFQAKESKMIVMMYFNGSPKKLADCKIDTRCILDPHNVKICTSKIIQADLTPYVKDVDQCRITYKLSGIFRQEVEVVQKYTGPLNTSGYSIQQYHQRKYQVPSKDNMSVASYNPSSRYASNNKRDRDRDDSSVRKNQYGILGGLKSNISNQFTNNNDFDTRSGLKSMDNQANLNRILSEEQNKRSRIQAELSRNQVELTELKKKVGQITIENQILKQDIKKLSQSKDSASKEEVNALEFKLYETNNEIRDLKSQLEVKKRQGERMDSDLMRVKIERGNFQREVSTYRMRCEEMQRSSSGRELLQNQNNDLRFQIDSLRRFVEELKKEQSDKQVQLRTEKYRQTQELSSKIDYLRNQNQKLRSNTDISQQLQRKIIDSQEQIQILRKESDMKERKMAAGEKELEEYKNRLMQYQNEKVMMQKQIIRLKQDQGDSKQAERIRIENQRKIELLTAQKQNIESQSKYYQQQLEENQQIVQRMKMQHSQHQSKSKQFLSQINQLQKKLNDSQAQLTRLKSQNASLHQQRQNLAQQLEQSRSNLYKSTASTTTNPQFDRLFRQSLQMQVDLKFANDQVSRLRDIQQKYENQKWKAQKEEKDRMQLQTQCQQIEKELIKKNRTLIIESEKTKVLNQQLQQQIENTNLYKQELQKQNNNVYEMEQQLQQLTNNNQHITAQLQQYETECGKLREQVEKVSGANLEQMTQLQNKNRDLQFSFADKVAALQQANSHVNILTDQIQDLKQNNNQLRNQILVKDKSHYDFQFRVGELQKSRSVLQQANAKLSQQRKMLQKRNEMIMEQIHKMKKTYEEEKGRSLSFTRGEQFNKIRTLQSQMQKKERNISKLNKQKLQLQEQNVKINVQVMKLLSQLQKVKSGVSFNSTSSFKNIHSLK